MRFCAQRPRRIVTVHVYMYTAIDRSIVHDFTHSVCHFCEREGENVDTYIYMWDIPNGLSPGRCALFSRNLGLAAFVRARVFS